MSFYFGIPESHCSETRTLEFFGALVKYGKFIE